MKQMKPVRAAPGRREYGEACALQTLARVVEGRLIAPLLRSADAGDFGAALGAGALHSLAAVLQRDLLGVLDVYHHAVFYAVSLSHFFTSKQI